jgi:glycosyltransferase involved in cell wall biosynthesis
VSREKNLDGLLQAFESLLRGGPEAVLVIAGDGPYREELQSRCQGRPIVFTGLLDGEDLTAAYAGADVMVFPSTTDTFGNVVLEAQASGLPVIVTDRGGPAEIARRHESGIIVDPTRPQALADAMERVYLSAQLRAELRTRGLRNAAESSWENVLEEIWPEHEGPAAEAGIEAYRSLDSRTAAGVIAMDLA